MKKDDERIPRMDMDHVHLPDPISSDILELQADNARLHEQLAEMEERMKIMQEAGIKAKG